MSPAPDERERIRAGMDRLLNDQAEHSNGALTIVALAQESQVPRNALTQRHTDLKNEFYEQVKARGATPDVEVRLRTEITKLKKTIANKNNKLKQFEEDIPALVRAVHILATENQELREQLSTPHANVLALHPRLDGKKA
jgi:chromosome segregation ATPase